MKYIIYAFAIAGAIAVLSSCKRSGEDAPDYGQGIGRCRLKALLYIPKVQFAERYKYDFTYNESSQLLKYVTTPLKPYGPSIDSFGYLGHRIVHYRANTLGHATAWDTINVGSDNLIQTIFRREDGHAAYHYDSNSELRTIEDFFYPGSVKRNFLTWQDGDLLKDSLGYPEICERHTYNMAMPAQIANYWRNFLTFAGSYPKSKHVLMASQRTSYDGSVVNIVHKYGFDAQGKIIADSIENGPTSSFEYECQ